MTLRTRSSLKINRSLAMQKLILAYDEQQYRTVCNRTDMSRHDTNIALSLPAAIVVVKQISIIRYRNFIRIFSFVE